MSVCPDVRTLTRLLQLLQGQAHQSHGGRALRVPSRATRAAPGARVRLMRCCTQSCTRWGAGGLGP